ncbi:MAG: Ig-like domain-containing protein, partial [Desulfobacterales bacterium]|nr:Ig-like domain-containing protein [Desulfobacterales bacterium]
MFTIAHTDVTATVQTRYNDETTPLAGVNTYVFTEAGSYQSLSSTTGADGRVTYTLPDQAYKIRADYLSAQYWSDAFTATDTEITVEMGEARVQVLQGSSPVAGITVYVFTDGESYTGVYGTTDGDGTVSFRLPQATWKFRADVQGSQYWASAAVSPHQETPVTVDTGGGAFTLTVEKSADNPITGINVYAFSSSGSYLGLNAVTDDGGIATLDLSDGDYRFRADYLGYQFWTGTVTLPEAGSETLSIPHENVTVTVSGQYQDTFPIEDITTYLFTESGSYQSVSATTDANGQAVYSLPAQSYRIRADYLSAQYWSDAFVQADTAIVIDHAKAVLTVTLSGTPVSGAQVYLFSESESYLGKSATTDDEGKAEFTIPSGTCKFRIDTDGSQYWTDALDLVAFQENPIAVELDPSYGSYEIDANTVLLISSDTSDGDTEIVDSSSYSQIIVPEGDVQHKTARQKFGASSIYFDGDGDKLSGILLGDTFTKDFFTVDCWIYVSSTGSSGY